MLLGIRYSIYTDNDPKPEDTLLRSFYQSTDNVDLYKNTYALPLGFLVSDSLEADWDLTADDPGINWNNLVHSLGIADDLFVPLDVTNNGTTSVNVTTTEGGYYCFYSAKSGPSKIRISHHNTSKTFDNLSRSFFMSFDYQTDGSLFTITNDDSSSSTIINLSAYRLNEDVLKKLYEILDESPMEVTSYTSTSVDATITASADDMTAFKDTFVSFEISEGTHTIRLDYTPDGFYLGLASTLICIILLIMIAALIHLWKKNQAEEASLDNQEEISASQATALADSEDLENDLSEPTDGALDDETDNEIETDDSVIVEDDDLSDEFFEEDSNEPEKIADEELSEEFSEEFSNKDFSKELSDEMLSNKNFSKTDEKRDSSAKKNVSLDSIELDLTRNRHNSLSKKTNKDSQ